MYAERLRIRPKEAILSVIAILGVVASWYHALTAEFAGDPVADPVGWAASSTLAATWLTFCVVWLAWMEYLSRKGADA